MVVCASDRPRSAIISTRSRRLSLKRRYQRTHRMITSRSKCRPANNPSRLLNLLIVGSQIRSAQTVTVSTTLFAPEPSQIVAALVGETIGNHAQRGGLAGAGVGFDLQIIATGHCIEHGQLLGRGVESCEHGKSRRALMLPAYGPRSEE